MCLKTLAIGWLAAFAPSKQKASYATNNNSLSMHLIQHLHINCEHSVGELGTDAFLLGVLWQRKRPACTDDKDRVSEWDKIHCLHLLFSKSTDLQKSKSTTNMNTQTLVSCCIIMLVVVSSCSTRLNWSTTTTVYLVKLENVRSLRCTRVPARSSVFSPPPFFSPDTFSMPFWNSMCTSSGVMPGASAGIGKENHLCMMKCEA